MACVTRPQCGWCGDKNKCIDGTSRGPLAPCLKSTFLYNKPTSDWDPLRAGTINIYTKRGEKDYLHLAAHPDFNRVTTNYYN